MRKSGHRTGEQNDKIYENRIRRLAARRWLRLRRSRRRDPGAVGYGMYYLTDMSSDAIIFGHGPFGPHATLEEIEELLLERDAHRR